MAQVLDRPLSESIEDLRKSLRGKAFLPGEDGFDQAVAGWNLLVQHQPAAIISVADEGDAQTALRFADQNGLPVAVQATGHGQFRTCVGGLLLDVSALNRVEVCPETKTAKVGGGTQWGQVIEAAGQYELLPISGSAPHVGVVGYTLGGGYGILSRRYGLGVDQVLSLRLINAQGEALALSPNENSEIFWAILGGGGAFGVVTEIEIQLHDQPEILGGSVMFDASLADVVYPAYLRFTKQAPEEVTSALTMMTFPPVPFIPELLHGRSMLIFSATAIGELAEAEALLAPMRSLDGAEFDAFRPMTYADTHEVFSDPIEPLPATCRGVLVKDLDEDSLAKALAEVGPAPESPNLLFRIRHYGGAVTRGGEHETAVGRQRQANYLMYFLGVPMGASSIEQMHAQAERVFGAIHSRVLSRGPLNWLGEGNVTGDDVKQVFSAEEYMRQLAAKLLVDPNNRFRSAGVGLS